MKKRFRKENGLTNIKKMEEKEEEEKKEDSDKNEDEKADGKEKKVTNLHIYLFAKLCDARIFREDVGIYFNFLTI